MSRKRLAADIEALIAVIQLARDAMAAADLAGADKALKEACRRMDNILAEEGGDTETASRMGRLWRRHRH
jgi:hypothetical protein